MEGFILNLGLNLGTRAGMLLRKIEESKSGPVKKQTMSGRVEN